MARRDSKERYRVAMRRDVGKGRSRRATVYTHAASPAQAERYAHFQKPGFSVTRVTKDPAENPVRGMGIVFSKDVHRVEYEHAETGEQLYHDFEEGVVMEAMPDGSIMLYHPKRRTLWKDIL